MDDARIERRVTDLLDDAIEAAAAGDWRDVRSLSDAVLALRPGHPEARRLLGQADAATATAGERRQLTVMFCDVVGSTRWTQHTDPEIVRHVLRGYRGVLDEVITRHGGHIAAWQGDGALIYFGHPHPHEDDAWRAVRAGLDLVGGLTVVADDARREHGVELAIRVAVHTGLVVRAEMGTSSAPDHDAIVGETPAVAARLQEKARPGTVLVSEATHALVEGRFSVVPVGPFQLRGVNRPIGGFEVQNDAPAPPKAEVLADRGVAMVGRSAELARLRELWEQVRRGGNVATLIRGDSGIGKTRLAAELRRHVLVAGGRALTTGCSSYLGSTPLHPVRRLVEAAAGIGPATTPDDIHARLAESLDRFGRLDALPVIADLLGVEAVAGGGPPELEPARLRDQTLEVLVEWMTAEAGSAPVLVVLDDIQWADPTTLELLTRIIGGRAAGLFVLLIARTGMRPLWSPTTVPVLDIEPLDAGAAEALVADLGGGALGPDVIANLVARSDGMPLYAEELVRAALADAPVRPAAGSSEVPASLRDPLLSRLAATGGDLALAQTIATIGDDVPLELLAAVCGVDAAELVARVEQLIGAGVLEPIDDGTTCRFHHKLLADLAYETQLLPTRRDRHAAAAAVLRERPELLPMTSGTALAHHLEHAGRAEDAIEAYLVVTRDVQRRGSHAEALQLLDHCAHLLPAVAPEERPRLELRVLHTRGFTLTSTIGYGSPEAATAYRRTAELLRSVPPEPEHDRALISAFTYFALHGDLAVAEELNQQYRRNHELHGIGSTAMPADAGTCITGFFRGDVRGAIAAGERFFATPAGQLDAEIPEDYPLPNELVASVAGFMGALAMLRLEPERTVTLDRDIAGRVAGLGFPYGPYSRTFGLSMLAIGWWNAGLEAEARRAFAEIRTLLDRHGLASYEVLAAMQDAMTAVRYGPRDAGVVDRCAVMVEVWKATGVLVFLPCFGSVVVAGRLGEGDADAAIALADEYLAAAARMGAHYWDAPLVRMRGEARLARGDDAGADDLLRSAVIAAEQGARLFELQARTSLYRLVPEPMARKELTDFLDSLPVALDLPDIVEARALVDA